MRAHNRLPQVWLAMLSITLLLALLIIQGRTMVGALLGNVGSVYMARHTLVAARACNRDPYYSRARRLFLKVADYDTVNGHPLYLLGSLYWHGGEWESAIRPLQQAVVFDPTNSMAWYMLGSAHYAHGNRQQAVSAWRKVPNLEHLFIRTGRRYADTAQWDLALGEYQLAVDIAPDSPRAHEALGQGLVYGFDRFEEGIAAYQLAVQLGLRDGYVWVEIAHALDMAGKPEDAADLLDEKGSTGYLASAIRGNAFMAKEMVDEAIEMYLQSLTQLPDNPWTYLDLGRAYLKKGQISEAVDMWQSALQIDPDFGPAIEALQSISEAEQVK